ncbi:adenosylcobinamide-GDP ribazoletransferase [Psychromonas algarum]|uniref:adenosylcobinamide-GDP ribazoletransferase n=1 Tax=Psychromonas algarum TaxID=2555643 RepID=UPI001419E9E6|nr:adenosylcobinamide-GDP ribazoletransferase [Psychromonas sp. RZ22]
MSFKSIVKKQWVLFCYALSFFSRVPVAKSLNFKAFPFHLGNLYFPLVGLLYACVVFAVYYLANGLFHSTISIILMLLAGLLFTGAFHEDGLADTCDAFGGGYNKKQRLAIMKDSQIGTYGSIGLILLFALKIAVLIDLSQQSSLVFFGVLVSAAVLSRFSVLSVVQYSDYARDDDSSKSAGVSQKLPSQYFLAVLLFSLLILCWMPILWVVAILAVVAISTLLCRIYFQHQIDGYTGDCLGFLQQLNELLIFLTVLALLQ